MNNFNCFTPSKVAKTLDISRVEGLDVKIGKYKAELTNGLHHFLIYVLRVFVSYLLRPN